MSLAEEGGVPRSFRAPDAGEKMDSRYLLGIDVGTTSLKAAIIDEHAKLLGISSSKYRLITPAQNAVQIDAESAWRAVVKCVSLLKEGKNIDLSRIAGISISTLCPGLTALDENGRVLVDPIIYSDRRSTEEAEEILQKAGSGRLFEITANGSMAGAFSGSSMLWIKHHLPEAYERTRYFGHINTFLAQRMTGEFGIDYSNASCTNLFETTGGRKWSGELCEAIGIEIGKLPPLHESTDVMGGLIQEDLISLGIPKGTPVAIGGADTPCATLAAGVVKHGDVCESVGTTDVLTVCTEKPVFNRGFINRCHVVPGTWIYQGAMSFTGASNEWFLDNFYPDVLEESEGKRNAFDAANLDAERADPGCDGVVFLPYMLGERSPVWDSYARGVFFGVSLKTTRREMNRAVLEGCGYGLRQLSEIAERTTGKEITGFTSIGGGAKSLIWAQIKADITGKTLTILDMSDMAPIGAALLAGTGAGIFRDVYEASAAVEKKVYRVVRPNHEHDKVYDTRYQVYTGLYPALKDLFRLNMNA